MEYMNVKIGSRQNGTVRETNFLAAIRNRLYLCSAFETQVHIGAPGLAYMQQLIAARPKYDKAILSLRQLMMRKGMVLVKTSDEKRELVDGFNSDMSNDAFAESLAVAREKAPKAVDYLRRLIKRQEFQG